MSIVSFLTVVRLSVVVGRGSQKNFLHFCRPNTLVLCTQAATPGLAFGLASHGIKLFLMVKHIYISIPQMFKTHQGGYFICLTPKLV
jgi:hypothetical protein